MSKVIKKPNWELVELPGGLKTSMGHWYTITREGIEEYAPGLLKKYSLEHLLRVADDWLRSREQFPVLIFMVLMYSPLGLIATSVMSIVFYLFWRNQISAWVYPWAHGIIRFTCSDVLLYSLFICGLAYQSLAPSNWPLLVLSTREIGVLIGVFLVVKTGLFAILWEQLAQRFGKQNTTPASDRVLNMVLIRYAYKEGILTKGVRNMQDELVRVANYHKTRKKKS